MNDQKPSTTTSPNSPQRRPQTGGAPRPAGGGNNQQRPHYAQGSRPPMARPNPNNAGAPRTPQQMRTPHNGPRINDMISARSILLIDEEGNKIGVTDTREALRRAAEAELDLVEIVPNAEPPVCKIMDYGRHKYQEQKKAAEARKRQKVIEIKEIKLRPNIDDHDYEVKMRAARGFFEEGHKVKFTLRFRGREVSHADLGLKLLERVRNELQDLAKVEQQPRVDGKQAVLIMAAAQQK